MAFSTYFSLWTSTKCNLMKSKKRWFKLSNVTLKSFFASWTTENATFFSDDSSGRMALSHFLSLNKPKIGFWCCRESDVSSGRQSLGTHFLPLDQRKMRLGWIRKSDVSRGRLSLWTHFRPLDQPKMRLGWGRKSDVSSARIALSTYFGPLH